MRFPVNRGGYSGDERQVRQHHLMTTSSRGRGDQLSSGSNIHPQMGHYRYSEHHYSEHHYSDQPPNYPPLWAPQRSMAPRMPMMHRQVASVSSMLIPPSISQEMPIHSSGRAGLTLPPMQQTHAGQSEPLHRFWQSSDQALATPQSMSAHYSDPSYVPSSGGAGAYEPAAMHSHQPHQRSEPSRVQASRDRQKPYSQKGRLPKSDPYPAKQAAMPSGLSGSLQPYQGYGNPFGGLTTVSAAMLQSTSAYYRFPHQSAFVGQSHSRKTAVASATVTSSASQPLVASSESQGAVFSPSEPEIKKAKIATLDTGVSVTKPVETDLSIVGTASLTASSRRKVINETCDTLDGIRDLMFGSLQKLYNIPKKDAENIFLERVLKKQASQVSQSGNISGIPVATTSDKEAGDPSSGSTSWIEKSSQLGLSQWEGVPCFEGEADIAPTSLRSLDSAINTVRDESGSVLKVPAQQEFQRSLSYPGAESTLEKKQRRRMEMEEEKKRLKSEATNTSMLLDTQNVSRESELPLMQIESSQNLSSLGLSQPFSVLSLVEGEEEKRGLIQAELSTVEDGSATVKKGKGKSKKGKGKKSAKKQSLESLMPEGEKERLPVPAIVIRRQSGEEYVVDTSASEKEGHSSGQYGQVSSPAVASVESSILRGVLEGRRQSATETEKDPLLKNILGEIDETETRKPPLGLLSQLQAPHDAGRKEQSGEVSSHDAPQHLSRAGMRGRPEHYGSSAVGNLDILAQQACARVYEPDVSPVSNSGSD